MQHQTDQRRPASWMSRTQPDSISPITADSLGPQITTKPSRFRSNSPPNGICSNTTSRPSVRASSPSRLIGKVPMRVLLAVAMAAATAGLASMAHLTATSTWLALLPGLILAGIGLGITSTGLASAALSAVEPARAGMAAGLANTLRQVGTATGVAVVGALYASRVTTATVHDLAGLPAPPGAVHRLAAAVASGAGTRVADVVSPATRAAAGFAAVGAVAGFAFGPDPAKQRPPSSAPSELSAPSASAPHQAQRPVERETTAPSPHQDTV
jgi:Major Facilitator Superfamily